MSRSFAGRNGVRRQALVALLLVLLPNLALVGVGLVMRGQAQQGAQARAAGRYDLAWFLCQVELYAFMLLLTVSFVVRHAAPAECRTPLRLRLRGLLQACGWARKRVGRALALGVLFVAGALLLRARPFAPQRLSLADT